MEDSNDEANNSQVDADYLTAKAKDAYHGSLLCFAHCFSARWRLGFFWAATKTDQKIKREPLQKSGIPLKAPVSKKKHTGVESENPRSYDPKPRVQVVDEKAGKYEFRWIGYDGKEKVVAYQHPDAIDVVVGGAVEKSPDGTYVYSYIVDILPSSATYLYSFGLQNFADDRLRLTTDERRSRIFEF